MTETNSKVKVKVEIPSLLNLRCTRLLDLLQRCGTKLADAQCGKVVFEQLSLDLRTFRDQVEADWIDFVSQNTQQPLNSYADEISNLLRSSDTMLCDLMSKLSVCQTNVTPSSSSSPAPAPSTDFMAYRQPTVNVPKFSGKFDDWKSFWSIFDALVH